MAPGAGAPPNCWKTLCSLNCGDSLATALYEPPLSKIFLRLCCRKKEIYRGQIYTVHVITLFV